MDLAQDVLEPPITVQDNGWNAVQSGIGWIHCTWHSLGHTRGRAHVYVYRTYMGTWLLPPQAFH